MAEKTIEQKIAQVERYFSEIADQFGNMTDAQYQLFDTRRQQAMRSVVTDYLKALEAAGANCPTLSDMVGWFKGVFAVHPEVVKLAEQLDQMPDERAVKFINVLNDAADIMETDGITAAFDHVNRVISEDEMDAVNAELAYAASEDRSIAPEVVAEYDAAEPQIDYEDDHVNDGPSQLNKLEGLVQYAIAQFPDTAQIDQSYGPDGTHVSISVFVPR